MLSQVILKQEVKKMLSNRKSKELCQEIGLHPTALSQFMKGRRPLLRAAATKYFKSKLAPNVWSEIESNFELEEKGLTFTEDSPGMIKLYEENVDYPKLNPDQEWIHSDPTVFITYLLFGLKNFQPNLDWFCERTGDSLEVVQKKLECLERLGFLKKTEDFYKDVYALPLYTSNVINPAKVERWKALGRLASQTALSPPHARFHYDYSFAISEKDLPQMQEEFLEFIARFDRRFLRIPRGSAEKIYTLLICLSPVSK